MSISTLNHFQVLSPLHGTSKILDFKVQSHSFVDDREALQPTPRYDIKSRRPINLWLSAIDVQFLGILRLDLWSEDNIQRINI